MDRRDKHNYYLDIAQTVSKRGTCLRRNFGAIKSTITLTWRRSSRSAARACGGAMVR